MKVELFYTYVWRDAQGVPFYVGKGMKNRANNLHGRSKKFTNIYNEGGCTVEIDNEFIHESDAFAREVELIALYGRRETGGLLVNRTAGGEGPSGLIVTQEFRNKMASITKGRRHSASAKDKLRNAKLGKLNPMHGKSGPKHHLFGTKHGPETRKKMSKSASQRVMGPEGRRSKSIQAHMRGPFKGYKGVCPSKRGRWRATINEKYVQTYLGQFDTLMEAVVVYDLAALARWGFGMCYLNILDLVFDP